LFNLNHHEKNVEPSKTSTIPAENAEAQVVTQKLSGSLQDSPHTRVMLSKAVDSAGFSVLTR